MDNLQGVFLVLEIGTLSAFIYGCVELVVNVYRDAQNAKVYFRRIFLHRLKFAGICLYHAYSLVAHNLPVKSLFHFSFFNHASDDR